MGVLQNTDMDIRCPNCEAKMKRQLPPNGGKPWVCTNTCENATNMTKDIQEISRGSNPAIDRRWMVPGSGKMSYTVSQWSTSALDIPKWRCSCPAWTRHMPRTDCKHILRVKKETLGGENYEQTMQKYEKIKYSISYGVGKPIKLTNIQIPGSEPKQKTVMVVVPTHVPKTSGRKFR